MAILEIASDIKKYDYYRYLCCLLAPADVRDRLIAIYAFNNEISKIKYVVSDPMVGYIRLQWWRDAIDEIYNGAPVKHSHIVVNALYDLISDVDIDKELFVKILDARDGEIEFSAPKNMDALTNYVVGTCSNVFDLLVAACEVNNRIATESAHYAGIAYGLVHLMRYMRYNAYHRKVMLPQDLMVANCVTEDEIIEGRGLDKTRDITRALCDKAMVGVNHVRALKKDLPKESFPALMPICLVEPTVKKIRANNYDLFDLNFESSRFGMQCNILFSKVLERV